jgi:thiol:disulfide interchange protein DsbD
MNPDCFWKKASFVAVLTIGLSILSLAFSGISTEVQKSGHVKAQLISEVHSIQPGQSFWVALWLQMEEHWHTYWKNPGDSGLPTKIIWNLPEGFEAGDIQWPYPQKFEEAQLVSFGYEGEVFLLTEIEAPETIESGSSAKISASVDWVVCKESCVLGHADLSIDIPVKDERPIVNEQWTGQFEKTRRLLPKSPSEWKIKASATENKIFIQAAPPLLFKKELKNITFFPEQEGVVNYSELQNLKKSKDGYIIEIQRSKLSTKLPARLKGVIFSEQGLGDSEQEHALHIDVPLHGNIKKISKEELK